MPPILKNKLFIYLAGLAFFFVAFRYYGYFEDAGRYLLQAVHMLHPERFVDDVPFMFGNQDEFTIFSPLIALFFKAFGVNYGGIVAVLGIEFLWGVAAITLFIRWFEFFCRPAWALPAFIACVVTLVNKTYGSGAYFPILDHILVARFFAEVFILFGLAFLGARNKYISLIFFFIALLFHPLMGGVGYTVVAFLSLPQSSVVAGCFCCVFSSNEFLACWSIGLFLEWVAWQYGAVYPDWERRLAVFRHFDFLVGCLEIC